VTNTQQALNHLSMWGSDAYTVRKMGSKWTCDPFFGMTVSPTLYKTKREAVQQFENFYSALIERDKAKRGII
jgi:hypothetical protein